MSDLISDLKIDWEAASLPVTRRDLAVMIALSSRASNTIGQAVAHLTDGDHEKAAESLKEHAIQSWTLTNKLLEMLGSEVRASEG